MYKKLWISFAILVAMIFSFTVCFANDGQNMVQDAVNGVRNVVGGAENAVENAAKDISNTSKNVTGTMEKDANRATNAVTDNHTNHENNENARTNNYTATRTSTGTTDATFMGMNATSWTWLIIGIAAIAIVALVWYYSMQVRSSNYDDRD